MTTQNLIKLLSKIIRLKFWSIAILEKKKQKEELMEQHCLDYYYVAKI